MTTRAKKPVRSIRVAVAADVVARAEVAGHLAVKADLPAETQRNLEALADAALVQRLTSRQFVAQMVTPSPATAAQLGHAVTSHQAAQAFFRVRRRWKKIARERDKDVEKEAQIRRVQRINSALDTDKNWGEKPVATAAALLRGEQVLAELLGTHEKEKPTDTSVRAEALIKITQNIVTHPEHLQRIIEKHREERKLAGVARQLTEGKTEEPPIDPKRRAV